MNIKMLGAFAAVALLAACAQQTKTAQTGTGAAVTSGPVPGSEEDLVANVGDRVFFDFNRSNLKPDARATLDRQAAWMAKYASVIVQVAGNCDDRGTEEYNLALGSAPRQCGGQLPEGEGRLPGRASPRSATARTARRRAATTSRPGRRTATRSRR